MEHMVKAGPGRTPRYERGNAISFRPHVRVAAVLDARAKAAGLSRAEYTEYLIASRFGMPECAPEPQPDTDDGQEPLIPDPSP